MSDAIQTEQRLHGFLHGLRRKRNGQRPDAVQSAREMEQQVVDHLFAYHRSGNGGAPLTDLRSARETERDAVERLYGGRTGAVRASRETASDAS